MSVTDRLAEEYVKLPGRASHLTSKLPCYLPGPTRHSAATLQSQVANEGHNNKELAP
jgi:hypothetical protein